MRASPRDKYDCKQRRRIPITSAITLSHKRKNINFLPRIRKNHGSKPRQHQLPSYRVAGGHPCSSCLLLPNRPLQLKNLVSCPFPTPRTSSNTLSTLTIHMNSCRDFHEAAEEDRIFEQACLERIPVMHQWLRNGNVERFIDRCTRTGNPEALYRLGMVTQQPHPTLYYIYTAQPTLVHALITNLATTKQVEYFTGRNRQLGLEIMRRASIKGHKEAMYVYGILRICMSDEASIDDSRVLNSIENSDALKECRENVASTTKMMWINNHTIDQRSNTCDHPKIEDQTANKWEIRASNEDDEKCELCKWDEDVKFLCGLK